MGNIRFGVCTSFDHVQELAQAGYDYIELGFAGTGALAEEDYRQVRQTVLSSPIRAEAFNGMLPGEFRLTGEDADLVPVKEFCKIAFARAGELGGKVVVFGSGKSRNVPEGFPREKAYDQLAEFLQMAGEIAAPYGIRLAIEPLNRKESNILNSVGEAAELCEKVNSEYVGVLSDLYHVGQEKEDDQGILRAGKKLWHCHIAEPVNRTSPMCGDGGEDWYRFFFHALHSIDYDGRLSIEGRIVDFSNDIGKSLAYLKELDQFTANC